MPESQWASIAQGIRLEIASPESISYLYHRQRLSIRDIAHLTLQTQGDVRRIIRAQSGQPDSNRARRSDISRQWFEEHYLGTGKTVRQAATEAGCSRNTLRFYAHKHNIPFGANAPAHNPFAASKRQPPPDVIAAFAIRNGTQHIRHVVNRNMIDVRGVHGRHGSLLDALNLYQILTLIGLLGAVVSWRL